jgi:hypothetical protein
VVVVTQVLAPVRHDLLVLRMSEEPLDTHGDLQPATSQQPTLAAVNSTARKHGSCGQHRCVAAESRHTARCSARGRGHSAASVATRTLAHSSGSDGEPTRCTAAHIAHKQTRHGETRRGGGAPTSDTAGRAGQTPRRTAAHAPCGPCWWTPRRP